MTNGEVIEYHPLFRFGSKLQFFPKELQNKLDWQRKEYKEKGNINRSGGNMGKKVIKKMKKDVKRLGELVSLMSKELEDIQDRKIAEANSNPMGGKEFQASKEGERRFKCKSYYFN